MKEIIDTTYKTTVTFSTKEFLEKLGLEGCGTLELVLVSAEVQYDGFDRKLVDGIVVVSFKPVEQTREKEE